MKFLKILMVALLLSVSGFHPAFADTFEVDPTYSTIIHKVKHLMGYNIGLFEKFEGAIELDEKNKKIVSINVTIDINSINTRIKQRDDDLKSGRFFDAANHPKAVFKSTKITKNKIVGDLTLKGITKKVTLNYTWSKGVGKDQHGNTKMALTATGEINRTEFGIDFNEEVEGKRWLLGEEVELSINVQGMKKS